MISDFDAIQWFTVEQHEQIAEDCFKIKFNICARLVGLIRVAHFGNSLQLDEHDYCTKKHLLMIASTREQQMKALFNLLNFEWLRQEGRASSLSTFGFEVW